MKLTIKVTVLSAGKMCEDVVETSLSTIVQWERHFKRRAGDLAAGFALEDLAYMAWATLKKQGLQLGFDEWLETVELLEVIDSEESHPTEGAATAGS